MERKYLFLRLISFLVIHLRNVGQRGDGLAGRYGRRDQEGEGAIHEKSAELKAKNTVNAEALPIPSPIVWAVEA